uniref:Uncharacterized protein n=1 Tax=Monodelphis domestica TaxID=13616 RepID=A0A5F8G7I1_MONDO
KTCSLFSSLLAGVLEGVTLASVPVILGAAGFTGTGIVAGSLAAKMMSAAAVANGGGIASGSLVAVLQSVVELGVSPSVNHFLKIDPQRATRWCG